jgi:hypothetical protein
MTPTHRPSSALVAANAKRSLHDSNYHKLSQSFDAPDRVYEKIRCRLALHARQVSMNQLQTPAQLHEDYLIPEARLSEDILC